MIADQNNTLINFLPSEILFHTLSFLSPKELAVTSLVSPLFYHISKDLLTRTEEHKIARLNIEIIREHYPSIYGSISNLYINKNGELEAYKDNSLFLFEKIDSLFVEKNLPYKELEAYIKEKEWQKIVLIWNTEFEKGVTTSFGYQIENPFIKKIQEQMIIIANQAWKGSHKISKALRDHFNKEKTIEEIFKENYFTFDELILSSKINFDRELKKVRRKKMRSPANIVSVNKSQSKIIITN